ncbi:hypothetical protein POM88_026214 [Heracleum sosnowskyi]|uniref:Uncharacterized protein n=1 Tax=Heracleum sosnowskyi TaxID=360622 RepID=A0AAD8MKG7_9APIA|nr:hypothetical protein POM88_026214 [Heracleum sosnowskyi]
MPNFLIQISQVNWRSVFDHCKHKCGGNRINKAEILFPGVGCFLIAVCLASGVHAKDNKAKLSALAYHEIEESGDLKVPLSKETNAIAVEKDPENGIGKTVKAKVGTADFVLEIESRRSIKVFGKSTSVGLGITFFCFSLFSP